MLEFSSLAGNLKVVGWHSFGAEDARTLQFKVKSESLGILTYRVNLMSFVLNFRGYRLLTEGNSYYPKRAEASSCGSVLTGWGFPSKLHCQSRSGSERRESFTCFKSAFTYSTSHCRRSLSSTFSAEHKMFGFSKWKEEKNVFPTQSAKTKQH